MTPHHVTVSFPQPKRRPTAEEALLLEVELKDQQLKVSQFIGESRLAMTHLLNGDAKAGEFINNQLMQLQDRYLTGEWHDSDLTCDMWEALKDLREVGEIWDVEDFKDHLRPLFWCIDLEDVDGYEAWRRIAAGLDELADLSSEGVSRWVQSEWVIGAFEPVNEARSLDDGLWRRLHRVAALPAQVRELIGLQRLDECFPPTASADSRTGWVF